MEYEAFLLERRSRMADLIRVAFRKLGGEADAPPLTPPWFVQGTQDVWGRIVETERALRGLVREVYLAKFQSAAPAQIEAALSKPERDALARALRSRPPGADPLSVVDYLYLGQLPSLLFAASVWQEAHRRLGRRPDAKHRLQSALAQIVPVRNAVAHVRELDQERLVRAGLACSELLKMIGTRSS